MFFAPNVMPESKTVPTNHRGYEQGDLPLDDSPPADSPSESYASWRPTAIFSLAPFGTRPGT
jgi:hypothetical protein